MDGLTAHDDGYLPSRAEWYVVLALVAVLSGVLWVMVAAYDLCAAVKNAAPQGMPDRNASPQGSAPDGSAPCPADAAAWPYGGYMKRRWSGPR